MVLQKKNCNGSHILDQFTAKRLRTIKLIKWQFMQQMCGMIRDNPGMLRFVGLHCVLTDFSMGGKETEDVYCFKKEKCFAGQPQH